MDIATLCRHDIVTIDEQASLQEAALRMRSHHVGALVVTAGDAGQPHVTGIVTDRDLAIEVLARGIAGAGTRVGQIASRPLAAVPVRGSLGDAAATMHKAGVRRLLVTEDDGTLAGIISADDLFEALAAEMSTLAGALRAGIARESTERPAFAPAAPRPVFLPQGTPGWQT